MDMSGVKALLFDKDGTLLDLHGTWGAVLNDLIWHSAGEGEQRVAEDLARIGGFNLETQKFTTDSQLAQGDWSSIFQAWQERLGPEQGRRMVTFLEEMRTGQRTRASVALGEIRPTIETLVNAGYVLGIATNDSEAAARRDMADLDITEFCTVIYGHDSHGNKPGPEMMQALCRETGFAPKQVAMVGDTMTDLDFARNAGAHSCIGVIEDSYVDPRFRAGVDVKIEHVREIPALLGIA
ncbi:MAG: HAD family hydrolase [Alphaproteobacteria bacterium TMED89]|nr:hypothetical protein [Rhodospirillaceae bacterium]RPH11269.1 MAG: HAD family hydrolase [Alphaproteobacteria bacterium TMED89]